MARMKSSGEKWILTAKTEHHAVSKTAEQLEKEFGFLLEWLDMDQYGAVTPESMRKAVCNQTALASVMYANNEIGTINPIPELAEIARVNNILFHTDAVQAAAYLDLNVKKLGVDLLSLGGHKFYGPKGVGALYVRNGTKLIPHMTGGGQEYGLRAGTQNVPYIVGFAEALRFTAEEREKRIAHVKPLRDRIIGEVLETIPDSQLTGHPESRLPNHASFVFKDVDGNLLLQMLDSAGFACSSGSACKTGNPEPSEVITSLGYSRDWALGSLRVTLGVDSTPKHVDSFLNLPELVESKKIAQLTCLLVYLSTFTLKTKIITLESHDDLISVRDKLSWANAAFAGGRICKGHSAFAGFEGSAAPCGSLGAQLGLVTRRAR